jgi:hypothetical protein
MKKRNLSAARVVNEERVRLKDGIILELESIGLQICYTYDVDIKTSFDGFRMDSKMFSMGFIGSYERM